MSMSKSADAFRTISEVSEWLDTPAHVLRFWESRFPQIKPLKRAGGRRYYRPADMMLLGGIKKLLHEDGITIRGVQKILREKGVKHVCSFSPGLMDGVSEAPETPLQSQADKPAPAPRSASVTPLRPRAKTGAAKSDTDRPTAQAAPSDQPTPEVIPDSPIPDSPMAEDLPLLPPQRDRSTPTPLAGFEGDTPEFLQTAPPVSSPSASESPSSTTEPDSGTASDIASDAAVGAQTPSPDAAPVGGFAESPAEDQPRGDSIPPADKAPAPIPPAQTEPDSRAEVLAAIASTDTAIPDDPEDDDISVESRPVTALLRVPAAGRVPLPEQQRRQLGQLAQQLTGLRERVGNDTRF